MEKKCYLLPFAIMLFIIVSCDTNPLSEKKFYGDLVREKDSVVLSPVVLDFNKDVLKVYSDAVFGKNRTDFNLTNRVENRFYYSSPQGDIMLCVNLCDDNNRIKVTSALDSKFLIDAVFDAESSMQYIDSIFKNDETVYNPDNYLKKASYKGFIYRKSDNKKLSRIALLGDGDSIKIYSSVIFGVNNIDFNIAGVYRELDCFKYSSNDINDLIIYSFENGLKLEGYDFYAELRAVPKLDLSFFNKKNVSVNVSDYPVWGSRYSGEAYELIPLSMGDGTLNFTVDIIDENEIKVTTVLGIKEDYYKRVSLFTGTNPNHLKMYYPKEQNKSVKKFKYHVNKKGDLQLKGITDNWVLSEDGKVLKYTNKNGEFAADLKFTK